VEPLRLRTAFNLEEIGGAFVYVKGKHAVKRSPPPVSAQQTRGPE
jgi:hypothetical protein